MVTRLLWGATLALLLGGLSTPRVNAATVPSGKIGMNMVVVLPEKHHLAIYEQVTMHTAMQHPVIGIARNATHITAIHSAVYAQRGRRLVLRGAPKKFALRYLVPWNRHSLRLSIPSYLNTGSLVFLVNDSLHVPTVLNPSLQSTGRGRIPGVPNSPVFKEYVTATLMPGQSFPMVIEDHAMPATHAKGFPIAGTHPVLGAAFQVSILLLSVVAILVALNWHPVGEFSRRKMVRDHLLQELAALKASHGRGEVLDSDYQGYRDEIISLLAGVWEDYGRIVER